MRPKQRDRMILVTTGTTLVCLFILSTIGTIMAPTTGLVTTCGIFAITMAACIVRFYYIVRKHIKEEKQK